MDDNKNINSAQQNIDFYDNCLDLIKLIAACIVVLSHSFRHFGYEKPTWLVFLTDGSIGTIIFFAISGFLAMASYDRCVRSGKGAVQFLIKRILRIYPPVLFSFIIVTIINYIMGFNVISTAYLIYFVKNYIFLLGGVFEGGVGSQVFWTLICEIAYYLLTPFIYKALMKWKTSTGLLMIFLFWGLNVFDWLLVPALGIGKLSYVFGIAGFIYFIYEYMIGAFLYIHREDILFPLVRKRILVLIWSIVFLVWYIVFSYSGFIQPFGQMHNCVNGILVAPLVIFLGYSFGKIRLKYELSFGIYIYHMVVIGTFLYYGYKKIFYMPIAWLIVLVIAFLELVIVEKNINKLTSKVT